MTQVENEEVEMGSRKMLKKKKKHGGNITDIRQNLTPSENQ